MAGAPFRFFFIFFIIYIVQHALAPPSFCKARVFQGMVRQKDSLFVPHFRSDPGANGKLRRRRAVRATECGAAGHAVRRLANLDEDQDAKKFERGFCFGWR